MTFKIQFQLIISKINKGDILDLNPAPKLTILDCLWNGHKRCKIKKMAKVLIME